MRPVGGGLGMLARRTALIRRTSTRLQESWRPGTTAKKGEEEVAAEVVMEGFWGVCVGGGLAQSEINNSTLIHRKPVITARPPVAKAFHSERLQRVGGGMLLPMFMKCLGGD